MKKHDLIDDEFYWDYISPITKVMSFGDYPFKTKSLTPEQMVGVISACCGFIKHGPEIEFFHPIVLCDLTIPTLKKLKAGDLIKDIEKLGEFVWGVPASKFKKINVLDELDAADKRLDSKAGVSCINKLETEVAPRLESLLDKAVSLCPVKKKAKIKFKVADCFLPVIGRGDGKGLSMMGATPAILVGEEWPSFKGEPLLCVMQLHPKQAPAPMAKRLGGKLLQIFFSTNANQWGQGFEEGMPVVIRLVPLTKKFKDNQAVNLPKPLQQYISSNKSMKTGSIEKWTKAKDTSDPSKSIDKDKVLGFAYFEQSAVDFNCPKCEKPMDLFLQLNQNKKKGSHLPALVVDDGYVHVFQCAKHLDQFEVSFETS